MAIDLAVDFGKHDLVIAPNNDLDIVSGQAVVDQRIRIRDVQSRFNDRRG